MNRLTDNEVLPTQTLCNVYGYGHMMELISALWRKKLAEDGIPTEAAFIPTITTSVRGEYIRLTVAQSRLYDTLVKEYFDGKRKDGAE